jgi:flagellar biosynthesis protein FlhA
MLTRVRGLRRQLATELGFIVPPVHITDNLRLKPREYVVSLRGTEIGRWQTEQNCVLAVNSDPKARPIAGTATQEPAFGVAARWIAPGLEEQALAAGYSVVDQTTVIATHVGELIRRNAQELLGRQEVKRLLDAMNESHPKLVEELVPKLMTLGEVQKVLQQLLREQVSIRDLGAILEVLVEAAAQSKSTVYLVEAVRQAIGRSLVHPLLDADGGLRVLVLASGLEQEIVGTFDPESASRLLGDGTRPAPAAFLRRIVESVKQLTGGGPLSALPVLLVPSPARYHMRRWLEPFLPKVTVLSPAEIPPMVRVRWHDRVGTRFEVRGTRFEEFTTAECKQGFGGMGWRSIWTRARSTRCSRRPGKIPRRKRWQRYRRRRRRSENMRLTTSIARARSTRNRCRRSAR